MGHAKDMVPALMMPGEFAVPPDKLTPGTLEAIKADLKANGIAFDDHIVGSPSVPIDPDSGLPMFNGGGGGGNTGGGGSGGGGDRDSRRASRVGAGSSRSGRPGTATSSKSRGRAGGVGTVGVGGGFSSTSANKARAASAKSPSEALGLDPFSASAIPGLGSADLAFSLAKAIGPAIQGAFESVLGGKGTAPAIDTSDTRVTGAEKNRGRDRPRSRSSILLSDALGKITPTTADTTADAKNVVNPSVESDLAAERVRLAARQRRGRRASILANISKEEAGLANISRPGAGSLTFGG